jgi:hypothetical protein
MTELPVWSLGHHTTARHRFTIRFALRAGAPAAYVLFGLALRLHRLRFELVGFP